MAGHQRNCGSCGSPVPEDVLVCPRCHALLSMAAPDELDAGAPANGKRGGAVGPVRTGSPLPANPFAAELGRRLARVGQWAEAAEPLGVELPRMPGWAIAAARAAPNPEPWAEVVRGIERLAQRRIITAFEEWERREKSRLARLEAYAVDSRLEREQIDDALHAARVGDVAAALATFQQVDRVVALKERHLVQAREELERVVALLKDLEALGLPVPQDPAEAAKTLEGELRAGRLASLKQLIRALRQKATERVKSAMPKWVAEYGDFLLRERAQGIPTEREAVELAQGARDVFHGRTEDGIRRLRGLQQSHGSTTGRSAPAPPRTR
ncbi:MAG TPA: zinc ribbon domain-containing protein [Candidatus Methylomirabilis sp.]|nr:zinc ribbon domain-containing protein [Candidatus Methylomirabilis sp.]